MNHNLGNTIAATQRTESKSYTVPFCDSACVLPLLFEKVGAVPNGTSGGTATGGTSHLPPIGAGGGMPPPMIGGGGGFGGPYTRHAKQRCSAPSSMRVFVWPVD